LFKADHHGYKVINQSWLNLSFPWFYRYNILRGLDVLTKLGYIEDERLSDAVQLLLQKRRPDGKWILESAPIGRMQANLETVGKPSRWITLYALRVLKRLHKLDNEELKEK
ncbi:MAG: nitrogen fixation protein NifH, partial [Candidatus Bathyarchaeia archaeon]